MLDDELREILVNFHRIDRDQITPEASLIDMGMDSVGFLEFAQMIKEHFAVEITEIELEELGPYSAIVDAVRGRIEDKGGVPS